MQASGLIAIFAGTFVTAAAGYGLILTIFCQLYAKGLLSKKLLDLDEPISLDHSSDSVFMPEEI